MKAEFLLEWVLFVRNFKNKIVFFLFLIATVIYGVFYLPQYTPIDPIEREVFVRQLEDAEHMVEQAIEEGWERTSEGYQTVTEFAERQLESFDDEDWEVFLPTMQGLNGILEGYFYEAIPNPMFLVMDNQYPGLEELYWRAYNRNRYEAYVDRDISITPYVLEERTYLQTIQRLLEGSLPYILIAMVIFYSMDILVQNKNHPSLIKGIPLLFSRQLLVKTAVVLSGFLGTLLVASLLLLLIVVPQYGFGSLSIPIPLYGYLTERNLTIGLLTSMGSWLLQAFVLLILIALVFIRGTFIGGLLFRHEFANLFIFIPLIFSEQIYATRNIGGYSHIMLLPPTFFSIGDVLTGYQNHLYLTANVTFTSGLISLGVLLLIIEIILFTLTRFHKYKVV